MQIVSGNALDVRVAVYHFIKPNSPHQFITFPMIHVGEPRFYQEIARRLAQCDIVLYEGINSKKGGLGISSYESLAKHLGLGLQRQELKKQGLKQLEKVEFIHADLSKQEFEGYWRKIPLYQRMFYNGYTFLAHLAAMVELDRQLIAKELSINLRDESPGFMGKKNKIDDLIVRKRDRRLIHHIERQTKIHEGTPKVIGIVYGAYHIQTIMQYLLDQQHYVVKDANWVIAFGAES
ncbi:MAG TPA: hypothetical protein DCS93_28510 [Microscillaceae bacterium]|nr:hypothetical protein [Microscillaceae bacterium]